VNWCAKWVVQDIRILGPPHTDADFHSFDIVVFAGDNIDRYASSMNDGYSDNEEQKENGD
jgi:hypothetical protein